MKYLGSSTIETDRLVLKAQTMDEQYYLWKVLMIPEVNKYFLTVPQRFREKLLDWNLQYHFLQNCRCFYNINLGFLKWEPLYIEYYRYIHFLMCFVKFFLQFLGQHIK